MKKLCSLLLALMMLLSLVTVSASAAGSDVLLPKSSGNPGLTVTLTGVISTKDVKVLASAYDSGELVTKETIITVYQLPLTGAKLKFTGKLDTDLFPGGFGGFSLIDGKFQSAEVGGEGQMFGVSPADMPCTESMDKYERWDATAIHHMFVDTGIEFYYTYADLSAYAEKPENPFTDVSKSDFYYDAVIWANKSGVTGGYADNTFRPAATCTRGQVVTFLWRAQGCPEPTSTANPFTDVKSSAYYYKAVLWAVEKGITGGYADNTFRPDATCTSGHVVTFLWRANGQPAAGGFNEEALLHTGKFYSDAVSWAYGSNLLYGVRFDPTANSPRSEIVLYLFRNAN